jgi:hypothetical protein
LEVGSDDFQDGEVIAWNDIKVIKKLGAGASGSVKKVNK